MPPQLEGEGVPPMDADLTETTVKHHVQAAITTTLAGTAGQQVSGTMVSPNSTQNPGVY